MLCEFSHGRFMVGSPTRSHTVTNRRLESFDDQAFYLRRILHMFTMEHSRPKCVLVEHRGHTCLREEMNVGAGAVDYITPFVCGPQMIYLYCAGKQKSIILVQF